jgi:DNA-directed RNA polymerase subunit M/transcription elongation factor TFIIS
MNTCPCCSDILLRHVKENQVFWFCRNCWQSMPVLEEKNHYFSSRIASLESKHQKSTVGSRQSRKQDRKQWEEYSAV